jgi:hypothetical protein
MDADMTDEERRALEEMDIDLRFHDYGARNVLEAYRRGVRDGTAQACRAYEVATCPHCRDHFDAADITDGDLLVVCAMCAKAGRPAARGGEEA